LKCHADVLPSAQTYGTAAPGVSAAADAANLQREPIADVGEAKGARLAAAAVAAPRQEASMSQAQLADAQARGAAWLFCFGFL
jgi:hypothetical protein